MAIQDDNTILNKGDLKAYHEAIAPLLGGTFMVSTNNSEYYSTDEKVVGVWTDGKPIYQKTFTYSSATVNSTPQFYTVANTSSYNIDKIINCFGNMQWGVDGPYYSLPFTLSTNYTISVDAYLSSEAPDLILRTYRTNGTTTISDITITLQYTKTTDAAGSATATPGAYDINFPNTWPENTEIYFGNGLYGMRKAETTAANNLQSGIVLVSNVSKTACCYNKGGMIDMSGTNGTNWYDINGGWDNKGSQRQFNPLITNTNQTLKFYCQDNQDYTTQNIQYNIWFTYTK